MSSTPRLQTVFTQKLDRAVFGTFFLGAVVPLLALGWVSHEYVLPRIEEDGLAAATIIGPLVGVATLTLASFFALRRIVQNTVDRMDAHNRRLGKLLVASRSLAVSPHAQAVAESACRFAVELCGGHGAAALIAPEKGGELELYAASDDRTRKVLESRRAVLFELAQSAHAGGRSASLVATREVPLAAAAVPIASPDAPIGVIVVLANGAHAELQPEGVDAVATLATLTAVALENGRLQDSQRNFFAHTTEILASALDQHVKNRQGHAQAVARLSNRIGRALGLAETDLQTLHYAALLHDIGMLKIEPSKHLSANACRVHVSLGHRMLSRIHLWREVAPLVQRHHERFDGNGYPDGLAGDAIPRASRIIALADSVDAMWRAEGDRPSMSLDEVVAEVESCAGTQFDPEIVGVFKKLVAEGQIEL